MLNSFDIYAKGFVRRPTIFYDPNASGSGNAGTFRNPYTSLSTVIARCAGDMSGQVLGIKRGSYTKGTLTLSCYGTVAAPFSIVPYGDAAALPIFSGETARTSWTQYSGDNRIWQLTGIAQTVDIYDTSVGERLLYVTGANLAAKVTAIQNYIAAPVAGTGGAFAYDGTTLYAYFNASDSNPNLGQILTADATNAIRLASVNGNVIVAGIGAYYARDNALYAAAGSASISASRMTIVGVEAAHTGAQGGSGLGQDAICLYGFSPSQILSGSYVAGNYLHDCQNNAVELAYTDGTVLEHNVSNDICGNSIVELWSNNTNATVRFNRGYGDVNYAPKHNVGHGCGIWATNYSDGGGVNTDSTLNGGHVFAFNYIQDAQSEAFDNRSKNNTYICNASVGVNLRPGTAHAAFQGNDATLTGCIFKGNFLAQYWRPASGNTCFLETVGASTPIPASDYNAYFNIAEPGRGFLAVNQSTSYTQIAAWTAATSQDAHSIGLTASGTGLGSNVLTQAGFALASTWLGVNTDYLLTASAAQAAGPNISSYGYNSDIDGAAISSLTAPAIGCHAN